MMRFSLALVFLIMGMQSAYADVCKEKFIDLMTDRTAKERTKIFITQQIKGGAKTVNWNYQDGEGNWLTEMVEPENAQWSMGFKNTLYSSSDKGETWTKVRDMGDQSIANETVLKERADTVANASCGTADLDGVTHETIEADYQMLGSFEADIHDKFWVHAETGYVSRLETNLKNSAFESFVVQMLQPAPDFVFPKPD